jgi:Flp pilus assembly protein TadG
MRGLRLRLRDALGLKRLLGDSRGTTSIEVALIGPFLVFLGVGAIELALDMIVDASVQIAAQSASRAGLTTTVPTGESREQQAQVIINRILKPWTQIGAKVSISEVDYGSYANVGTSNTQTGEGGLGDVVAYNVTLQMEGFTGIPRLFGVPLLTFQRSYLVQNEK